MPHDRFNREINYLRISLTDHCNLRCVYCMPLEGLRFFRTEELLTPGEIEMVVRAALSVGFRKFRLTGGEPTLRPELLEIVERIARLPGVGDLGMTTNGVLLPDLAPALARAGLRRVNIHLDSLDPARLSRVMRFGSLDQIWAGLLAAEEAGLRPIKINTVVTRGYNDEDDVVSLAGLTRERTWHVRFIELMPVGNGECATVARQGFVPNREVRQRIEAAHGILTPLPPTDPSEEARNYRLPNAAGIVGFISPVSEPYCGNCNRMRLTANGRFHLCLLNDDELDVRRVLRAGADETAIGAVLLRAAGAKPTGHRLPASPTTTHRQMFQIGG